MNLKKLLITLVQAAVTLLLLWWIFHDPSKRTQMLQALGKANPMWLVPAFLSFGLVLVCGAFRWQLLMRGEKNFPRANVSLLAPNPA
jgi:uncharacterized membrane protein YbhN (UPF0104 family)